MSNGIRPCVVCEGSGVMDPEKYEAAIRRWLCVDCGNHSGAFYKVRNSLWRSVVLDDRKVQLCIPCLDRRVQEKLGRRLLIEDFPITVPINHAIHLGYRLGLQDGRKQAAKDVEEQCPECAEQLDPEES